MSTHPTHRVAFDPAALTDDQRDGTACVVCGLDYLAEATPTPHVPVGMVDGGQLFACASHGTDEPLSFDAVEGDLVRIIKRLEDAVASHDPAALDDAIRTARPCLERVRAWLDAREATK